MFVLPEQLAPAKRQAVLDLIASVTPLEFAPRYPPRLKPARERNRCHFCHRGGKLGGHHDRDGSVVWTHKSCHRRHHRAHQHLAHVAA